MARFKIGERVLLISEGYPNVSIGDIGTVLDKDTIPDVLFENGIKICVDEDDLDLYVPPQEIASQIAQVVEKSIKPTIDTFEFRFKDEYGRELIHKFEEEMGIYTLVDVVASFRLFLRGVGWEREEVDKFINSEML